MGPPADRADEPGDGWLSGEARALLTVRALCQQYPGALPSQVLAEPDGGLLLQLLEVDHIVTVAESDRARSESMSYTDIG